MKRRFRHGYWLLLAVAAVAAFAFALRPRPVKVEVTPAVKGLFEQSIDKDGKTRVRERYTVSAPLAGRLQRIRLKAGDAVRQGELVAVIVPSAPALLDVRTERELHERLGAAEAARARSLVQVTRAQAALAQSQADYARNRTLAREGFVSQSQLERARLQVNLDTRALEAARFEDHAAVHQVEQARAALLRLQQEAGGRPVAARWEIHAPVSGRVLKIDRDSEGDVAPGTALLEIGDPADLEVVVDVLTTDAVNVHPNAPVRIDNWGGPAALMGRVRRVEPGAYTKVSALGIEEQRSNIDIDIVSPRPQWQTLGDGYRVDAHIIVYSRKDALKVPASALFRDGNRWAVFIIDHNRARKRTVQVGHRNGIEAEITGGLAAGEQVVLYPGDALKDDARVRLAAAALVPAAAAWRSRQGAVVATAGCPAA